MPYGELISHGAHGEQRGFRVGWRAGRSSFWRVLGLGALAVAFAFAVMLAIAVPLGGMVGATFALTDATLPRVLAVAGAVIIGLTSLFVGFIPSPSSRSTRYAKSCSGAGELPLRSARAGGSFATTSSPRCCSS